ncbi:MAG: hypothetical protein GQ477_06445, partial [Nanohaloarchaea archaeon]|nr:hypothetical protein [Candidatus Nanohaloarchaea archaeon]
MKLAISAEDNTIESLIDQRFGRCKYFLIVELENDEMKDVTAIENEGALQGHGAGIKASQQLGDLDVDVIITGNLGPNSTAVLKQLGIRAVHASGIAEDAVTKFIKGELEQIDKIAQPHSRTDDIAETESERIFFPLLDDNGLDSKISQHFGHAPFFGLYDVKKKELRIIENNLNHTDPDKSPIDQIQEAVDPTTIFARGIGGRAIEIIAQKGLSLKTGDYTTLKDA